MAKKKALTVVMVQLRHDSGHQWSRSSGRNGGGGGDSLVHNL